MSVILRYLHSRVGILYHVRVFFAKQISTAYTILAHCRTSIPHRLGPLTSECYTMVSTLMCRYTLPCKSIVCRADIDAFKMLAQTRTSIPHRLGPLTIECYTTTSVRTHHRESIPDRLGPLLSKCFFYGIYTHV